MINLFVDTNIFLSLYAFTDNKIEELRKLVILIKSGQIKLHVTSVVNQEFNRNRDKKILESLGNFERFSAALSIPRFMDHHDEVKDLRELLKEVSSKHKTLLAKSKTEISSLELAADKLFREIRSAAGQGNITESMDKAAKLRLERSNPPGKDGSLGDRQNWEYLLKTVPEKQDLHIVSRDKDFSSPWGEHVPHSFLRMEWEAYKNSSLFLYPGLRAFAKAHFPDIELASEVPKKLALKKLETSKSFAQTHLAIAELTPLISDFAAGEAVRAFKSLLANSEIRNIASDNDVEQFYGSLLVEFWQHLSAEDYKAVTDLVPDPIPF